jgi:hypothetical protein
MPALADPVREAQRVAAVRAALQRDKRWLRAAEIGNFSAAVLRRRGQNSVKSGIDSLAFKLAVRYCEVVIDVFSTTTLKQ